VLEQLDFLIEMVRGAPRGKAALRKSLEALRKAIG
jgi:hypothetical protein